MNLHNILTNVVVVVLAYLAGMICDVASTVAFQHNPRTTREKNANTPTQGGFLNKQSAKPGCYERRLRSRMCVSRHLSFGHALNTLAVRIISSLPDVARELDVCPMTVADSLRQVQVHTDAGLDETR